MKIRGFICFLFLILACGSQKKLSQTADNAVRNYLPSLKGVLIDQPSDQSLLEALNDKHNYYSNYNPSVLDTTSGATLKHIFSGENMHLFKEQLKNPVMWAEKTYITQTVIPAEDKNKYKNKTIYLISQPVATKNRKYVLLRISFFNQHYMSGTDELLIFRKEMGKWSIYKRFELSLY